MNQKPWMFVLFALLTSSSALAAPKKKTTVKTAAPAPVSAPAPEASRQEPAHESGSSSSWVKTGSVALGSVNNGFNIGVTGRAETHSTLQGTRIRVGAKTGFLFNVDSPNGWNLPILGSVAYDLQNGGAFKPSIGLDMGVSITHYSGVSNAFIDTSSTRVKFAMMIVPAAHLSDKLIAELPFGTMGGGFTLLPTVGMHF